MTRTREELQKAAEWYKGTGIYKYKGGILKAAGLIRDLSVALESAGWDYCGIEADIEHLVESVRKATDLKKLQELTEMNYPEES